MQPKINTSPLSQLVQCIKAAELNNQKEVRIPMQQARLITLTLVEIMDKLNQDYESMFNILKKTIDQPELSVIMDGGGFEE